MTRKRILLINPPMRGYYRDLKVRSAISTSPPLNLASLAGAAIGRGHEVRIIDLTARPEAERGLSRIVRQFRPDMVGLTVRTPVLASAIRIARRIRRVRPDVLLVAGGAHSTARPADLLDAAFDVAVIGEGEQTLCDLADCAAPDQVSGIAHVGHGQVVRTPPRARLQDLDALPQPAWHLFRLDDYRHRSLVAAHPPVADLESSRGCPSRCIYCTHTIHGYSFRAKSPERFVREVRKALEAGFRSFNLVDDNFTADLDRAVNISERLRRENLRVPWTLTNGIRVSHCDKAFFRLAARSGLRLVAFGLESGSQRLLDLVGKGTRLEDARRAVAGARSAGVITLGYFMVGLPGETWETLQATIAFARELDLDFAKFSIALPLPGTPLYEQWRPYINETHLGDMNIHRDNRSWLTHPEFLWSELEAFVADAYRAFYLRPDYVVRRMVRDATSGDLMFHIVTAARMRW